MVIFRASADAPNTFAGQIVAYARDNQYQEKIVIRATINAPIEYATPLITFTMTGVSQAGLQDYTSP